MFTIDRMRPFLLLLLGITLALPAFGQREKKGMLPTALRKPVYEEVNIEDVMKRYFEKSLTYPVEGIYSVSCVVTRRSRKFLSGREKVRVVARQDNYAKVAIMKDWPATGRDFIEVSLSYSKANAFPIMGELDVTAEGRSYLYTHIEPDGERMKFSMLQSEGILEAEFSKIVRRKIITWQLSYLKIYPVKREEPVAAEY
jgi:hypothetical protein